MWGDGSYSSLLQVWQERPWLQLKGQCWLASFSCPWCKAPAQTAGCSTSLLPCDPMLDSPDHGGLQGHGGGQRLWQHVSLQCQDMRCQEMTARDALNPGKVPQSSILLVHFPALQTLFSWLLLWDMISFAGKITELKGQACGSLAQALSCYGCLWCCVCWVGVSSLSLTWHCFVHRRCTPGHSSDRVVAYVLQLSPAAGPTKQSFTKPYTSITVPYSKRLLVTSFVELWS